jgi:nitrogen fixation NifU-like protein
MSDGLGGYNAVIIDHFKNPRNVGEMPDADVKATEGSPACGDQITLYLKVDKKEKKITDVKFQSYGCASNIATGSIITEIAKGRSLDEAKAITWQTANEKLGGLPPVKVHCAVLAVDALKSAIEKYEVTNGLAAEVKPTSAEEIKRRMRHIIDPVTGQDIVTSRLVTGTAFAGGTASVTLDLDERHQFANNLAGEIREKLEFLSDVKTVSVVFSPVQK